MLHYICSIGLFEDSFGSAEIHYGLYNWKYFPREACFPFHIYSLFNVLPARMYCCIWILSIIDYLESWAVFCSELLYEAPYYMKHTINRIAITKAAYPASRVWAGRGFRNLYLYLNSLHKNGFSYSDLFHVDFFSIGILQIQKWFVPKIERKTFGIRYSRDSAHTVTIN